jgi:hypothetical protein
MRRQVDVPSCESSSIERKLPCTGGSPRWFCSARARDDASVDSDWDLAVFLLGDASASDQCALADAAYDLIVESGQFIQPLALAFERAEDDTLLMRRIRHEGMPL